MSSKNKGLGKGLNAIFSSHQQKTNAVKETAEKIEKEVSQGDVRRVPIKDIVANQYQPRQDFQESKLEDLARSIKKHGILQPLLLTEDNGKYELIAGERRWRAAKKVGLTTVPAIIKDVDELERLELALIENIQRQDLNPIEKAESYKQLIDNFNLTQEEASKRLGKTRSSLANTLRLLQLPTKIKKAVADGDVSAGQARALLSLSNMPERQEDMFQQILQKELPVRKVEKMVKQIKGKDKTKSLPNFDVKDRVDRLQKVVQSKVDVKWDGKKGKVIIDIFNLKEIDDLIKRLS